MLGKILKYFVSLVILLHCIGVTQLMSACTKNNSAFVGMLSMTEEETKKEKESKEDTDSREAVRNKLLLLVPHNFMLSKFVSPVNSKDRIKHQFQADNPTPPPDSLG